MLDVTFIKTTEKEKEVGGGCKRRTRKEVGGGSRGGGGGGATLGLMEGRKGQTGTGAVLYNRDTGPRGETLTRSLTCLKAVPFQMSNTTVLMDASAAST